MSLEFLLGRAGTGKTTWFERMNPDNKILNAENLDQLRRMIGGTASQLHVQKPTLINVWFDLDCKKIKDLQYYDVTLEIHYEETMDNIKIVTQGNTRRYKGVKNLNIFPNVHRFIVSREDAEEYFEKNGLEEPHPERYPTYNHLKLHMPAISMEDEFFLQTIGDRYGMIKRNAFLNDMYHKFFAKL